MSVVNAQNGRIRHPWRTWDKPGEIAVKRDNSIIQPKPDKVDIKRIADNPAGCPNWLKRDNSDNSGRPRDNSDNTPKTNNVRVFRFSVKTDKDGKADIRRIR